MVMLAPRGVLSKIESRALSSALGTGLDIAFQQSVFSEQDCAAVVYDTPSPASMLEVGCLCIGAECSVGKHLGPVAKGIKVALPLN